MNNEIIGKKKGEELFQNNKIERALSFGACQA